MSAICVYLSLPPYLAQWYAHTCRKVRHREDDISAPISQSLLLLRWSRFAVRMNRRFCTVCSRNSLLMFRSQFLLTLPWLWLFPITRIEIHAFSTTSVLTPNWNCRTLYWSPLIFACGRSCTLSGCASIGRIMLYGLSWRSTA